MTVIDLLLILGGTAGISLSLFFSLVLYRTDRTPPYSNQLLALLLFCLALRIAKSVFYNFVDLPLIVKNLGLACNLAVGPLLLLYGRSLVRKSFRLQQRDLFHFIPAGIYCVFAGYLPNGGHDPFWKVSYTLVLLQSFAYVGAALLLLKNGFQTKNEAKSTWYGYLSLGLAAMWLVYLLIFLGAIPVYLAGACSFTLLVGLLAYLSLDQQPMYAPVFVQKYRASNLDRQKSNGLFEKVKRLLQEEQLYLKPQLTLEHLANRSGTSPRILSQVINENTGRNFASLINAHRVGYAKALLADPQHRRDKVIAIALQSGFNSLSTFNEVFKRNTGMTPTQYRKSFPET